MDNIPKEDIITALAVFGIGTKTANTDILNHVAYPNDINNVLEYMKSMYVSSSVSELQNKINDATWVYEKGGIVVAGFIRICNMYIVPIEINQIIFFYLKQLNYLALTPIIRTAEQKRISTQTVINFLLYITKGAVKDIINELWLEFYHEERIYEITFECRPLGIHVIMDTRRKNCIVSSVQNETLYNLGLRVASRFYAINRQIVSDMRHKSILKLLAGIETPLTIAFTTPRNRIKINASEHIIKNSTSQHDDKQQGCIINDCYDIRNEYTADLPLLNNFERIASTGQLVLKYTQMNRQFQDRILKVKLNRRSISWGSGSSRRIYFDDVIFVSWGHWTPVFRARGNSLDAKLCFSLVCYEKIIDLQAPNKEMAELWVRGLRKIINQTDEIADKMAREYKYSHAKDYDPNLYDSYSSSDDEAHINAHYQLKGGR